MVQLETSKLFNDLFDLEKSYKHNMTVIKLQEEEIARCMENKKILEETINAKCDETRELKRKIQCLEESLRDSDQQRNSEKQICQEVINRLTTKINETNRRHEIDAEAQTNEIKRRCSELENLHMKILNERVIQHNRNLDELQEKLRKEQAAKLKLKSQLQSLMDENMVLRNRIRNMDSQLIPELAVYKNEVKTMKGDNANLKLEIEFVKNDLSRCKTEGERLAKELQAKQCHLEELIKENNAREVHNNEMESRMQEYLRVNGDLIMRRERDEKETERLAAELARVSEQLNRNNNDDVSRQNEVLRETVKAMRQERERLLQDGKADEDMIEARIMRLEQLIEKLKMSFVDKNREKYSQKPQ